MGYFLINEDVVDRNDLTIEEKMACVVLARYADIKDLRSLLSLDIIAVKMGCPVDRAKEAIDGLIQKGILLPPQTPHETVIPKTRGDQMPTYVYRPLDQDGTPATEQIQVPRPDESPQKAEGPVEQPKVQRIIDDKVISKLKDHFEEIVSESNIRLMLNLVEGDDQRILEMYGRCLKYPSNKRIEKLVDHLQGIGDEDNEKPLVKSESSFAQQKEPALQLDPKIEVPSLKVNESEASEEDYDAMLAELSASRDIKQLNQQINVKRIKQMYTTYGKK